MVDKSGGGGVRGAAGSGLERARPFTHERELRVTLRFNAEITNDEELVANVTSALENWDGSTGGLSTGATAGRVVFIQAVEPRCGATSTMQFTHEGGRKRDAKEG